jgi:hypothetical protein
MIITRVKNGVIGLPGDGVLNNNVRGLSVITLAESEIKTLTNNEISAGFKVFAVPGSGNEEIIIPPEKLNFLPASSLVWVYSGQFGVTLTCGATQRRLWPGVYHLGVVASLNAIVPLSEHYADAAERTGGEIFSIDASFNVGPGNLGRVIVYEGAGGDVVTIDGAVEWPAAAAITISNLSVGALGLAASGAFQIVGKSTLSYLEKARIIRVGATNVWYAI